MFQKHLAESTSPNSPRDKSSKSELKSELKKTQEELMSTKLREANCLSALKDTKQKIMELETSVSYKRVEMSLCMRKPTTQSQKMVRGWKFWI